MPFGAKPFPCHNIVRKIQVGFIIGFFSIYLNHHTLLFPSSVVFHTLLAIRMQLGICLPFMTANWLPSNLSLITAQILLGSVWFAELELEYRIVIPIPIPTELELSRILFFLVWMKHRIQVQNWDFQFILEICYLNG